MNIQNSDINYIINFLAIRNFNLIYTNNKEKISVFYSDSYKAFISIELENDGRFLFIGHQQSELENGKYFCHDLLKMFNDYLETSSMKTNGKFSILNLPLCSFSERIFYDTESIVSEMPISDFFEFNSKQQKWHDDLLNNIENIENLFKDEYQDDIKLYDFLNKLKYYIEEDCKKKRLCTIILHRLVHIKENIKEILANQLLDEYEEYKEEQECLNSIYKKYVKLQVNDKEFILKR